MKELLQKQLKAIEGPFPNAEIKNLSCIGGQGTYSCWSLELINNQAFFLKIAPTEDLKRLQCEADGLKALAKFADGNLLIVPKPLALEKYEHFSLLVLPWLEIGSNNQTNLGKGLALLHQNSISKKINLFGWENDSFIGAGQQPGGWRKSWGECFIELRIRPQMKVAKSWGLKVSNYNNLLGSLINYLNEHQTYPSIVHGDLWCGNAGVQKDGKGIVIDPASWWADREVDIAMTKLFGGFRQEFYDGYEYIWPLKQESKQRMEIYNLYHILNHANIFGGSYQDQSLSLLNKLNQLY